MVRPKAGEVTGGDAAFVLELECGLLGVIVDVLGHGQEANRLATGIEQYIHEHPSTDVVGLLSQLHEAFRGSRGAAIGLCVIEPSLGQARYAGIGNTGIRRFGQSETRLVSRDGIVGMNAGPIRTPVEQAMPLSEGDVVVMYTDGVKTHFKAAAYPGLCHESPKTIAANIVQRFGRAHDDAACVVMRYQR